MAKKQLKELPVIGWREWIAIPDMEITKIQAKIDSGARSSALHAFDVQRFDLDGKPMVRFKVHPFQRDSHSTIAAEAELLDERYVRNSYGRCRVATCDPDCCIIFGSAIDN